ncbi:hypothetical protein ACIQYS_09215 [Psychrobacillus sp. NPDC096426]|uniref:hypothetical protein n=1 Tax=Psychrobacillus sp. NPDC096426 TaxID=3364491 RepID=UPI00382ABB66
MTTNRFTKYFYSFLAFLLIFSTLTPFGAKAAGEVEVGITANDITEENITLGTQKIVLTLPEGKSWVNDGSHFTRLNVLKDSMNADIDQAVWTSFKALISETNVVLSDSNKVLTLTLPGIAYSITNNQNIKINLTGALIENWEGTVKPVEFTIYAQPEITLGGSILNATATDINTGGKTIELNLLNATWDTQILSTWTELKKVLNMFEVNSSPWQLVEELSSADPNKFLSFTNNNRTLKINLPSTPITINEDTVVFNPATLAAYIKMDIVGTNLKTPGTDLQFIIKPATTGTITPSVSNLTEATINTLSTATISLLLPSGVLWNNLDDAKKDLLINALQVKNQTSEWEKVKTNLKSLPGNISVINSNKTLQIIIPQTDDYRLTEDQVITLNVPYQLLQNAVILPEQKFTIVAKSKALIKGTVTPSISQADVVKGGKTIIVELVNAKWASDIATKTTNRETLLNGFDWDNTIKDIILASADVKRTSDKVVTITLPPIPGYKITSVTEIKFNQSNSKLDGNTFLSNQEFSAFNVIPTDNQSATISGSILSGTNEFDIVKGGKEVTITLKNDVWVKDINNNVNTIKINAPSLIHTINNSTITRISDTVVKFTLPPIVGFTSEQDTTATIEISKELLTMSNDVLKGSFKIADVKAELSGTASSGLDAVDLQKGGKTIIITLKNAAFNKDLPINDYIKVIKSGTGLPDKVIAALKASNDSKKITITNNKLTIKLPAVDFSGNGTLGFVVPEDLLANGYDLSIEKNASISVGAVATISIGPKSLKEKDLSDGTTLTLTLTGATWDPAIATNSSKQATLLKGFTTDDQTKEWATIIDTIKKNGTFVLDDAKEVLKITIPKVSDYAIVRDQTVNITIPKSVLVDYKYDIAVPTGQELAISVQHPTYSTTLGKLLEDGFDDYIKTGFETIRVKVPEKKIQTITTNTVALSATQNVTTIEVLANSDVQKVTLTLSKEEGTDETMEASKINGKFLFVLNNLPKNAEVSFSAYGSGTNKVQADIFKKIGTGNKIYNEVPKKDLTGSYSLYTLFMDKSLMKDILKYYSIDDLQVGK